MRSVIWIGLAVCSPFLAPVVLPADLAARSCNAAGEHWTIVDVFPVPEGASGLAYDGTWLYCGIYGTNGDEVYRIDPNTGGSILLFTGPQDDAFGLTYDGQYLWTTEHPGSSSIPAVAMQLDWSGDLLAVIDLPDHYMSGIAHDGGDFWVARYYPDPGHIYKVDAAGTILVEFAAPNDQPWDLCVENGNVWMADYWGDTLYKLDATSGAVLGSYPSEGTDPAGIAWDGQHLWYCDNGEGGVDFLYKVFIGGGGTPCPFDCADGDGTVGILDFLAVLAQWGTEGSCDGDGGGVGITDFLALLAAWGPCP